MAYANRVEISACKKSMNLWKMEIFVFTNAKTNLKYKIYCSHHDLISFITDAAPIQVNQDATFQSVIITLKTITEYSER